MNNMYRLQKIDEISMPLHCYLNKDDVCYFIFDYIARGGYAAGPGNSIISNLKKPVSEKRAKPIAYKYKERAINDIADNLSRYFNENNIAKYTFVPIPPSKIREDPEYDDRLMQILGLFAEKIREKYGITADIRDIISQSSPYESVHTGSGKRPSPDFYKAFYQIIDDKDVAPHKIIIFDDVLTTGAHFIAAKACLKQYYKERDGVDVPVLGFFVARRVYDYYKEDPS